MTALSWRELLALADCQGDCVGECDKCHVDDLDLYVLDDDDDAGWQYCRACLRKHARKLKEVQS